MRTSSIRRRSTGIRIVSHNPVLYNNPTGHQQDKPGGADGRTTTVRGTSDSYAPWQLRELSTPMGQKKDIDVRPPGHDIQVGVKPEAERRAPPVRVIDRAYRTSRNTKTRWKRRSARGRRAGEEQEHLESPRQAVWLGGQICPPGAPRGACVQISADPSTGKVAGVSAEIDVMPNFMKGPPRNKGDLIEDELDARGLAMSGNIEIPVGDNATRQNRCRDESPVPSSVPRASLSPARRGLPEGSVDLDTMDFGLNGELISPTNTARADQTSRPKSANPFFGSEHGE